MKDFLSVLIGFIFGMVTTILLTGCVTPKPVSPTPPVITDTEQCAAACAHLSDLGCEEGKPIPAGVECVGDHDCRAGDQCINRICHASCETFCHDTQDWGVFLNPTCVQEINMCGEIESCAR